MKKIWDLMKRNWTFLVITLSVVNLCFTSIMLNQRVDSTQKDFDQAISSVNKAIDIAEKWKLRAIACEEKYNDKQKIIPNAHITNPQKKDYEKYSKFTEDSDTFYQKAIITYGNGSISAGTIDNHDTPWDTIYLRLERNDTKVVKREKHATYIFPLTLSMRPDEANVIIEMLTCVMKDQPIDGRTTALLGEDWKLK